jgi:hypothetical protein
MLPNVNMSLMVDVLLALGALAFAFRLLLLRAKPEKIPYEKGSEMYELYQKSLGVQRIVIALIIALVFAVLSIFDIRRLIDVYPDKWSGQLLFITGFTLAVTIPVLVGIYMTISHRKTNSKQ